MTRLPPAPWTPKWLTTILWWLWPTQMMDRYQKQFGSIFTLPLTGLVTTIIISDPKIIKEVFTGPADEFLAGKGNTPMLPILGQGSLFLLDGKQHKRHRKLLMPPFHGSRLGTYADIMRDITVRMINQWPQQKEFEIQNSLRASALEIILRTVFGVEEHKHLVKLTSTLDKFLSMVGTPLGALILIRYFQVDFGPWSPWGKYKRLRQLSDEMIYEHINVRRKQLSDGKHKDDVLSMLLQAVDEQGQSLTDQELRDELITMIVAGHETTATTLTWAVEHILSHPTVLERLNEEIKSVLGDREIKAEDLSSLVYLDAILREVMRLRPIVAFVSRYLVKPVTVGGYDFPAGVRLAPSVYMTHRNPNIYDNPTEFRPERFLDKRPDPYSWLAFGGGNRRCIGMAFAMFEMKIILATIFQKSKLCLCEEGPVGFTRRSITLAPKSGVRIKFQA
jgi:cytochrome P450 family 110